MREERSKLGSAFFGLYRTLQLLCVQPFLTTWAHLSEKWQEVQSVTCGQRNTWNTRHKTKSPSNAEWSTVYEQRFHPSGHVNSLDKQTTALPLIPA